MLKDVDKKNVELFEKLLDDGWGHKFTPDRRIPHVYSTIYIKNKFIHNTEIFKKSRPYKSNIIIIIIMEHIRR